MLYIITLLVLVTLIWHFDIKGYTKYRMTGYYILMFWFTAISALQYCVGSDTPGYMSEYNLTQWTDISWSSILDLNNRQIGWLLLLNICKLVSNDFVVLKIVQSLFVNVVFFLFFKRQNKLIFTCILFYSLYLYLDINFNAIRQSISVAFFLLGYKYFIQRKWFKYYIFAILSLMFHNSAIIVFFLPFLGFVKVSRKSILIILFLIIGCFLCNIFFPFRYLLIRYISIFGSSDISFLGEIYLSSEKYGSNSVNVISFGIRIILFIWMVNFIYRYNLYNSIEDFLIFFAYLFLFTLNNFIPIFSRFNWYFMPMFICFVSSFTIDYTKYKFVNFKFLFLVTMFFFYCFFPIRGLFQINPTFNETQIIQFYPYYSVFDKKISPERANSWATEYELIQ